LNRFIFTLVCLLVASGVTGCGPSSQGTGGLAGKLTLEQLTAKADSILAGNVTDVTCYQEGEGSIYTLVTLSTEEVIKGESVGEVVIRVPGGEVGGLEMFATDTPTFRSGERAVVFLDKGDDTFTVVGGSQGKFTIDENNMVGDKPLTEFIDQIQAILVQ
jgi:hypothetical protein